MTAVSPADGPAAQTSGGGDCVIRVRDLEKRFRIYHSSWARLAGFMGLNGHSHFREVRALSGMSFDVRRGECFGILGRNGAGKSTLLRILKGALFPTSGTVEVRGRITLLELASGFHPELTGRENIYQSAGMLGLPMAEIQPRIDEIIEFSELGDFIDQRIRTYSSGMVLRLAFSLYAFLRPEIYIVDEAFAVGDVFFQQKCFGQIESYLRSGGTMVLVTHDTGAVLRLCQRAMVLREGQVDFIGPASEAVNRYYARTESLAESAAQAVLTAPVAGPGAWWRAQASAPELPDAVRITPAEWKRLPGQRAAGGADQRYGNQAVRIERVRVVDELGRAVQSIEQGRTAYVQALLRATEDVERLNQGVHLFDRTGLLVYAGAWANRGQLVGPLRAGEEMVSTLAITLALAPGEYTLTVGVGIPVVQEGIADGLTADRVERAAVLQVFAPPRRTDQLPTFYGLVQLPMEVYGTRDNRAVDDAPAMKTAIITSVLGASGDAANVGDEIIRLGVQNILNATGMPREDYLVCKVNMNTLHEQLPGEPRKLDDKLLDADLILAAGTPFLWNLGEGDHRCSSIHWIRPLWDERIRKVHARVPVLNLGIGAVHPLDGSVDDLAGHREIRYFLLWAASVCRLTTVRDRFAQAVYRSLDQHVPLLPCPAFLSAADMPEPPARHDPIVLNYMDGSGHFRIDERLSERRWRLTFTELVRALRDRGHELIFAAHSQREAELAAEWAGHSETMLIDSPEQAVKVYGRARAGVFNRVHGSICMAGLGRSAMLVGADVRLWAAELCGVVARPEWEISSAEIVAFIEQADRELCGRHAAAVELRERTRAEYLNLILPHLPRRSRYTVA